MGEERKETDWQQGFVLDAASAVRLKLIEDDAKDKAVVVLVSHDCDLIESSTVEPTCEVIIGSLIDKVDGNYTNGKNPRRLHLTFSGGSRQISAELIAIKKTTLDKDDLLNCSPIDGIRPSQEEQFTLQLWLAARYHRPIFPDEFDRRLGVAPV